MRRALAPLLLATLAAALALLRPSASAAGLLNGDFEGGAVGWAAATGGTLTIDASQPVASGAASGHVQSTAAGTVTVRTQYWLTPAAPGNQYTMSLAVRIPAATISSVTARIELVKTDGSSLASNLAARAGPTAGYVPLAVSSITAPPGTAHVLVVISGSATAAGARFSVDDIVITETAPTPTPTVVPTVVDDPPPDPNPGPAVPLATPPPATGRVVLPRPRATPPPPVEIPTRLVNTTFDANLAGWTIARGRAWTDRWIPGEGQSMVLYAGSSTTVWVEQAIGGIEPGGWYQANALLSTRGNVEAGWMRIAWHSTDNASGASITIDDSFAVVANEQRADAAAPRYQVVGTGAIQAPPIAGSATVRFLLRTDDPGGAWLIIDNVSFARTQAPDPSTNGTPRAPVAAVPPPTSAATPAIRPSSTAAPTERDTSAARATSASRAPSPSATATSSDSRVELAPGILDAQRAIRMTQILPDPAHPGRDHEYEWIELTNLGISPASVEGMTIRDNSGSVTLPALVIPPGGMLVVTARLADVAGATAFRLPQGIGNGLGNSGDRLVLASADGQQVDAFSYGDDTTFQVGARIPVPGTGRAIERRFGPDGTYRDAVVVEQPTPGRPRAVAASTPTPAHPATGPTEATATTGALGTWVVLLALGAGLLGGAVAQRIASITRDRK